VLNRTPGALRLVGGSSALDFTNTVVGRLTAEPLDHLGDYAALLEWARHAGVIDENERIACSLACANPAKVSAAHCRAIALREALYGIFSAVARKRSLPSGEVRALDREVRRAGHTLRLVAHGESVTWEWPLADPSLPLARIALAAARLLTDDPQPRVRSCAGAQQGCGWLFLDRSRGGTRRWCSMDGCGNRAKVRAHYQRSHTT
jgi:predicted RNA-binding Zn ribbon-like protein